MSAPHGSHSEDLQSQLRFEELLADLSARFVNLPLDRVDATIEDAQRVLCESLDIDRSSLWQTDPDDPDILLMTHLHQSDAGNRILPREQVTFPIPSGTTLHGPAALPEHMRIDGRTVCPWITDTTRRGVPVVLDRVEDLPPEAATDLIFFQRVKTKSTVIVPLTAGGQWCGLLTFASIEKSMKWPEFLVNRFRLIAQVFADVLAHERAQRLLLESEARLKLTTEAAGAGLWVFDPGAQRVWATARTRELFGFAHEKDPDHPDYEKFNQAIHPEDRDRVRGAVAHAVKSRGPLEVEFRVPQADGGVRWISARAGFPHEYAGAGAHLMGVSVDITDRRHAQEALERSLREIGELRAQLQVESDYLKMEISELKQHADILGQSAAIRKVLRQISQVAPTTSTVLITGETGTGKELVARAIHDASPRRERALVAVNSSAVPEGLIESELFGREKGAYTGALTRQMGRFEVAHRSTLFLDEIGDLPLSLQSRLLRVLEGGRFEHLGGAKTIEVDVRVIAATNRNLEEEVGAGRFRRDLFYRLNVFRIHIPPLRERPEDIPLLVRAFAAEFGARMGKSIDAIPTRALEELSAYPWPGNVRELRNVIEHAVIVSQGRKLEVQRLVPGRETVPKVMVLEEVERNHIQNVLEWTGWRVKGPGGAAELLGLKPTTLFSIMKRLAIPSRREKYDMSSRM